MPWHTPAQTHTLGAWSFELRDDEIADLSLNGRRVLRSVRAVVRDRDWNTAEWAIESVDASASGVAITLRTAELGADLTATVRVTASGDTLAVTFDAVSHTAFATNRTGLVVLHPPQVAGAPLTVTHPDGSVEAAEFPTRISPHQPVFEIAELAWEDAGVAIAVRFEGDVFEMEDQRNWTDASYKTYSRPLALPFPYELAPGERVAQSVTVRAREVSPPVAAGAPDRIRLRPGGAFPSVSVGAATAPDPAPDGEPDVEPIGADLLVELDLASPTWRAALDRAAAGGLPLDVRFVLADDDPGRIRAGVAALRPHRVARLAAFWPTGPARHVSDAAATALLREAVAAADLDARVAGGARSHFTELNREHHRLPDDLDEVVFSVTPLFHSLGTEQLVESVAMQRLVAAQAVEIARARPVRIGPVSLRPHFNDVATTPPPYSAHTDLRAGYGPELIDADDARQGAPELAAWTVASAAALAVPGVAGLSFFEEWGPRGIRTADGTARPVEAAVRALCAQRGELLWGDSPDGEIWAIGARTAESTVVLACNIGRRTRTVTVETPAGEASVTLAAGTFARLVVPSEI